MRIFGPQKSKDNILHGILCHEKCKLLYSFIYGFRFHIFTDLSSVIGHKYAIKANIRNNPKVIYKAMVL